MDFRSHTFVVCHRPPEGDLLTDAERDDLGESGIGGFVAMFFEEGTRRMHENLRRTLARAIPGVLGAGAAPRLDTGIENGMVCMAVTCPVPDDAVEYVRSALADLLVLTWERVANRKGK